MNRGACLLMVPLWLLFAVSAAAEPPATAGPLAEADAPATAGPFNASWESLDRYECPEWFRDAKLGIFVHWGLTSLQGVDDWYGFNMYRQGHRTYEHVEGRAFRRGRSGAATEAGRGPIRGTQRRVSRQLRLLEFASPPLELLQHGA